MQKNLNELDAPLLWKKPLLVILKLSLAFSLLSLSLGYFVYHYLGTGLWVSCIVIITYALLIVAGVRHLIRNVPIPVLMLLVPIAPLFVLIYFVALMAFLQRFT